MMVWMIVTILNVRDLLNAQADYQVNLNNSLEFEFGLQMERVVKVKHNE